MNFSVKVASMGRVDRTRKPIWYKFEFPMISKVETKRNSTNIITFLQLLPILPNSILQTPARTQNSIETLCMRKTSEMGMLPFMHESDDSEDEEWIRKAVAERVEAEEAEEKKRLKPIINNIDNNRNSKRNNKQNQVTSKMKN
ncbi:unnamed protein product [Ambrosiozyma monospora]|uniref:Unnamed protein product n=1 Tax=Ambrosiozyma monospora TaxID=43982 RepID=A0ACB5TTY5_AMBMO|nr:unnamed protein product [Ambrosiozyma monospora]